MAFAVRSIDILHAAFTLTVLAGFAGMALVSYHVQQLPAVDGWVVPDRAPNIRVLAKDGRLLSNRGQTGGEAVLHSELPWYVPAAFVAAEDRRFHQHFGVDPLGLASVIIESVRAGVITRGASTITQQVAKNLFLTPDQTLGRKVQEAILALWLERNFGKDQILELYLNRVYFGSGATGIEAAAQTYFGRSARDLTLGQAAMLAGILPAPSAYNPRASAYLALERQGLTLAALVRDGQISDEEARNAAVGADQRLAARRLPSGQYVADWVEQLMDSYIGSVGEDVVVHTTIDLDLQRRAEEIVRSYVRREGQSFGFSQGALVSLAPWGDVLAMVGGVDYTQSQYNRAVTARRQAGSTFKPIVYAAAMEKGYTPDTVAEDALFDYQGWSPRNDSDRYRGFVTLREALASSINTIAARLTIDVTPDAVAELAMRLGISATIPRVPSIGLGTAEMSLFELTSAFVPFANGGHGVVPNVIERIETKHGKILYQRSEAGPGRVLSPLVVAEMNDLLVTAIRSGTGHRVRLEGWEVGGKTGTSQRSRDASFVGYTAQVVTGVWLGRDDDKPTRLYGGNLPVAIWSDFMTSAHEGLMTAELPGYQRLHEKYLLEHAIDPATGAVAVHAHSGQPVITVTDRATGTAVPL